MEAERQRRIDEEIRLKLLEEKHKREEARRIQKEKEELEARIRLEEELSKKKQEEELVRLK